MSVIDSALSTITDLLKGIVSLGISLALVFLVVDVLFPNDTDIVGNLANLIGQFEGLTGLIILIILVAVIAGDD